MLILLLASEESSEQSSATAPDVQASAEGLPTNVSAFLAQKPTVDDKNRQLRRQLKEYVQEATPAGITELPHAESVEKAVREGQRSPLLLLAAVEARFLMSTGLAEHAALVLQARCLDLLFAWHRSRSSGGAVSASSSWPRDVVDAVHALRHATISDARRFDDAVVQAPLRPYYNLICIRQ